MGDSFPGMPFTVISDVPKEPLMEVSTSPFGTSSGSGSVQGGSLAPPNAALAWGNSGKGSGGGGNGDGNDWAASGCHVHMRKWETFVQQNQLNVNIDPSIIEGYMESRIMAERSELMAAAAINQTQVQSAAESIVGGTRMQAEAALHVAAAKTEAEVTKARVEVDVRVRPATAETEQVATTTETAVKVAVAEVEGRAQVWAAGARQKALDKEAALQRKIDAL